ncbi:MAG: hypothetical protein GXP53_11270 [Deltaproteobacteria bacterium]|nr:hypothetical protein [Deltaproteobacteria bacterium]
MTRSRPVDHINVGVCILVLCLMGVFAIFFKGSLILSSREAAGWINFSLGFVLIAAYVTGQTVNAVKLPKLTGYILAGVLAGPFAIGFLTADAVDSLRLIDELALSIIALSAGAELNLASIRDRWRAIMIHIVLITVIVMACVFAFIYICAGWFDPVSGFTRPRLFVFALLISVVAVARSPSSTIALIKECQAAGPFTETVLSVTVVTDILVIILFTAALALAEPLLAPGGGLETTSLLFLMAAIFISLCSGVLLGMAVCWYIEKAGHDLLLLIVFVAFVVARASVWFNGMMDVHAGISLHVEPLLICMSAGFFVQNFSSSGRILTTGLDRISLPVYVLFFSLAGASLNFHYLVAAWPFALCIVTVRGLGLAAGSRLAAGINREPLSHGKNAWMTYLTQAGVAIGLGQLAMREFPEIGVPLNTVILAVIAVNQIVGPILFSRALDNVGESCGLPEG